MMKERKTREKEGRGGEGEEQEQEDEGQQQQHQQEQEEQEKEQNEKKIMFFLIGLLNGICRSCQPIKRGLEHQSVTGNTFFYKVS